MGTQPQSPSTQERPISKRERNDENKSKKKKITEGNTRDIGWENIDRRKYVLWNTLVWTLQDGTVYPFDLVKTRLQVQGVSAIV